ncbi:MAG: hypothetical protein VX949_07625 [Planctomycetota bacterium]|nr:hypothetical protein [Planctomycetota bacterium]
MKVLATPYLMISMLLSVFLSAAPLLAQDDSGPPKPPPTFIELTSIQTTMKKDAWQMRLVGKAPDLPAKTVIGFEIRWRTNIVYSFNVELDGTRRIDQIVQLKGLQGSISGLQLRSEIRPRSQPREVQIAMEKEPAKYPVETAPWKQSFWKNKFDLGNAKDIERVSVEAKKFFLTKIRDSLKHQRTFEDARTASIEGTRFLKGGKFDPKSWQSFCEKDVRDPIRKLQGEIKVASKTLTMLPHSRDLKYLVEIINAVAKRSFDRSRSLYGELGLSPDSADLSPAKIDINCRSTRLSNLQKTVERLCESQKIEMSKLST